MADLNQDFLLALLQRGVKFAPGGRGPFDVSSSVVTIELPLDDAAHLKKVLFNLETYRLSTKRCNECLVGHIVVPIVGTQYVRYSCTCGNAKPINPAEWEPIGNKK